MRKRRLQKQFTAQGADFKTQFELMESIYGFTARSRKRKCMNLITVGTCHLDDKSGMIGDFQVCEGFANNRRAF